MKPRHAAIISLVLALAVGTGAFAAQRTAADASANTKSADTNDVSSQIAGRTRALDRMEAALHKALEQRPPALPKMPKFKPVKVPAAPAATQVSRTAAPAATSTPTPPAPAQQRVITVRPPPHIVIVHRKGAEHDGAERDGAERDDGQGQPAAQGGGFDD